MRLIFMGTPDFAVPALDALVARRSRGRRRLHPAAAPGGARAAAAARARCSARAEALGLPVRTPATLRDPRGAGGVRGARAPTSRWSSPTG